MEKYLFQDVKNKSQRTNFIRDNADAAVEMTYLKPIAQEELDRVKSQIVDFDIDIQKINTEKKLKMKQYKIQLDDVEQKKLEAIDMVTSGGEYVRETCYKYVDRENRVTGIYNDEGLLIKEQPCTPEELQGSVFEILRGTGTNN